MTTQVPPLPIAADPLIAEAKRRSRRRYVLATALAAVVIALSLLAYASLERQTPQAGVTHPPKASLSTFVGRWGGHGKGLDIKPSGRGHEWVGIPSPHPPYIASLSFRVISVTGTPARPVARYRITSARHWFRAVSDAPVRIGTVGVLRLRRGVLTDSLMGNWRLFCGPGSAPAACGA